MTHSITALEEINNKLGVELARIRAQHKLQNELVRLQHALIDDLIRKLPPEKLEDGE